MKRPAIIRVKAGQGKRARHGAPWLFSNEIVMDGDAKALPPGTVVRVLGDDGREFGLGFFNPHSLIAVRLLETTHDRAIDQGFFEERLRRALALRTAMLPAPCYRLVNGEGDHLPGLIIDRYFDACVVQIGAAGMERQIDVLLAALDAVVAPKEVILRADAPSRQLEGLECYVRAHRGEAGRATVEENGLRYFADLADGQKTGWYFDQRDHRAFIAALAKDKSVLDAYCHSGGFALAAAKAGAREVMGIDSSALAVNLANEAATANRLACAFVKADVPDKLAELAAGGQRFDIVIADPPPFIKARKDLEAGARAYRKLAAQSAPCVAEGGILLLASCSHAIGADRFAAECAAGLLKSGRAARLIHSGGAGIDHPVHPQLPESAYLRVLVYALD